jgi:DNA invertase Pin-like site-specific DNA recombinase
VTIGRRSSLVYRYADACPFNLRVYVTRAKKAGAYKGRPAKIKADDIAALKARGLGVSEIARRLKIGRARLYRVAG